jgi:DNA helicase HerA-like ATPase
MDDLEAVLRQNLYVSPNRGHNRPPELLEIEPPVTQAQIKELATAIAEIRSEANAPIPNSAVVIAQASILRRFGAWLADASGNGVVGAAIASGLTLAFENRQVLLSAVVSAADAAIAWALQLPALY